MDENKGRKNRSCVQSPFRALHLQPNNQGGNLFWKRKRDAAGGAVQDSDGGSWDRSKALKRGRYPVGAQNSGGRAPMDFALSDSDFACENEGRTVGPPFAGALRTSSSGKVPEQRGSPIPCVEEAGQATAFEGSGGKRSQPRVNCIFCRKWSGNLEDFAWHVSLAHGIPQHVAVSIIRCQSKLKNREFFGSLLEESIGKVGPCSEGSMYLQ